MLKVLFSLILASACGVAVMAAIAHSMPDYEVEYSVTGKCKKVEYRGRIVPDGCALVKNGAIQKYEVVHGY